VELQIITQKWYFPDSNLSKRQPLALAKRDLSSRSQERRSKGGQGSSAQLISLNSKVVINFEELVTLASSLHALKAKLNDDFFNLGKPLFTFRARFDAQIFD
jgi:hypothetical protein